MDIWTKFAVFVFGFAVVSLLYNIFVEVRSIRQMMAWDRRELDD